MRLDPFYIPLVPAWLGLAYYMLKRYADALPFLQKCISRAPNFAQLPDTRVAEADWGRAVRACACDRHSASVTLARYSKSLLPWDFEPSKFESTARPFDTIR